MRDVHVEALGKEAFLEAGGVSELRTVRPRDEVERVCEKSRSYEEHEKDSGERDAHEYSKCLWPRTGDD